MYYFMYGHVGNINGIMFFTYIILYNGHVVWLMLQRLTTKGDVAVLPSDAGVDRVAPRSARGVVRVATVVLRRGHGPVGEIRVG